MAHVTAKVPKITQTKKKIFNKQKIPQIETTFLATTNTHSLFDNKLFLNKTYSKHLLQYSLIHQSRNNHTKCTVESGTYPWLRGGIEQVNFQFLEFFDHEAFLEYLIGDLAAENGDMTLLANISPSETTIAPLTLATEPSWSSPMKRTLFLTIA